MSRGTVVVELSKFSATLTGPRVRETIAITGVPSMPHATRKHKTGAVQVHHADADDVIAALEAAGQRVEIVDRRHGRPVAGGRQLGGAA
jgi:AICAR transformylase/IMP cyclohydrolase PurH